MTPSDRIDGYRVDRFLHSSSVYNENVVVHLEPPLDLGLQITSDAVFSRRAQTGQASFDARFSLEADEPDRTAPLLDDTVRDALALLLRHGKVTLRDASLGVGANTVPDEDWLERTVADAVSLARLVDAARGRVDAALALREHVDPWRTFAEERSLALGTCPLSLRGRIGARTVQALTRRTQRGAHAFRIEVVEDRSLELNLSLAATDLVDRLTAPFRRGPAADRRVGDEELDRAFDVRTAAPDALPYVFDAEVRQAILSCRRDRTKVRFRDRGATLEGPCAPGAPDAVPALVAKACFALERMHENLRRGPPNPGGPFR